MWVNTQTSYTTESGLNRAVEVDPEGIEFIITNGYGAWKFATELIDGIFDQSNPAPCAESFVKKLESDVPGRKWYEIARDHTSPRLVALFDELENKFTGLIDSTHIP